MSESAIEICVASTRSEKFTTPIPFKSIDTHVKESKTIIHERHRTQLGYILQGVALTPILFILFVHVAPYVTTMAKIEAIRVDHPNGRVCWLGIFIRPNSYISLYTTSSSFLAALLAPLIGAIADYTTHRRRIASCLSTMASLVMILFAVCSRFSTMWAAAGLLVAILFTAFNLLRALLTSYLIDCASNADERSKVSLRAFVWSNISQVVVAVCVSSILLIFQSATISPKGSLFKNDTQISYWSLRSSNSNDSTPCYPSLCLLSESGVKGNSMIVNNENIDQSVVQNIAVPSGSDNRVVYASTRLTGSHSASLRITFTDGNNNTLTEKVSSSRVLSDDEVRVVHLRTVIPPHCLNMKLEVLLQGNPGIFRVYEINSFGAPDTWMPILFGLSAVWIASWLLVTMTFLKRHSQARLLPDGTRSYIRAGLTQIVSTITRANRIPYITRFLAAFALSSAGIGSLASVFTLMFQEELNISPACTSMMLLGQQLFGLPGAQIFHRIGQKWGYGRSLAYSYLMWTILFGMLFLLVSESNVFWLILLIPLIGISYGGFSTQSKNTFALLVPEGQEAEFFGLFATAGVSFLWLGSLLFTLASEYSNLRLGLLAQVPLIGLAFLLQITLPQLRKAI